MDSPVGGDLKTIGSSFSRANFALCFSFGLGDNGELNSPFLNVNSGTFTNLLLEVNRCFTGFILLLSFWIMDEKFVFFPVNKTLRFKIKNNGRLKIMK